MGSAVEIVHESRVSRFILTPIERKTLHGFKRRMALDETGNECARFELHRGDAGRALEAAEVLVEDVFRTSWQEHVYLEPQGALAVPDEDGGVTVRGSIQCPYHAREKVAQVLGVPLERARIAPTPLGGGFGGKQDYPNEVAACAAVLARQKL